MLSATFGKLFKFPLLVLIPVIMDVLTMLVGAALYGFHGRPHLTFKFALQMGLPSINAVSEQGFLPGSVQLVGSSFSASHLINNLLFLIFFLIVQAFLQGGYVGLLHEAVNQRELSFEKLVMYGARFFIRFILLNLLIMISLFIIGGILTAVLQIAGAIFMILIYLLLRIRFLFLELSLVAEDCSIPQAFSRSRIAFENRTPNTLPLIGAAILFNLIAGLLVNALWLPLISLVLLILYDIVSAALQLAFMSDYQRIRR
ncbi:hypothetical protein [Paenibacillus alba]|uniref:DUF975 family protein n=1 Tax=Paenibacillus alba TaxID=1197127 RepID=A0ABU6G016_9BACL|nr:hypothetical protein [Paenibacillus alba]MEC0227310.1 hypothetical protein [Paenibacillus alba]